MAQTQSSSTGPLVIGTGLPRTGTTSLQHALITLGFGPCSHFRSEFVEEGFPWPTSKLWQRACYMLDREERQKILRQIFVNKGWKSCCDYPSSLFVEDLVELYPDAKFVHCERSSPQLWRDSVNESIGRSQEWGMWIPALALPFFAFNTQPILNAIQSRTKRVFGAGIWGSKDDVKLYHAHNDMVKRVVPKDKLLIFNPKDGYPVLCEFLGVPIPKDEEGNDLIYPHVNDRETMAKGFMALKLLGYASWTIAIAGITFTLTRFGYVNLSQVAKYLK
ncbi:hypothetical protein F5Y18DRAFT_378793 [Xylariaceae sp. FL1019]|nr:hypothetical protein F5Y18DRAFT_378793 [Xylariaceae sp. FL1019]